MIPTILCFPHRFLLVYIVNESWWNIIHWTGIYKMYGIYTWYIHYIVSWDLLNLSMDKDMNPCASDFPFKSLNELSVGMKKHRDFDQPCRWAPSINGHFWTFLWCAGADIPDAHHGAGICTSTCLARIYPKIWKSPSFVGFYLPAPWFASGIWIMEENQKNLEATIKYGCVTPQEH